MTANRPCVCKLCERTEREAGVISMRGLCAECGNYRQLANRQQLQTGEGVFFQAWLDGQRAATERLAAAKARNNPQ